MTSSTYCVSNVKYFRNETLGSDRYISSQTTATAWADCVHSLYFGANIFASAKNKNALKLMLGAEYTTARQNGSDCYNGWTYSSAVRWSF